MLIEVSHAAAKICTPYFGRGYCTDYIREVTGSAQSGDAATWTPNIDKLDVREGDVAIFRTPAPSGHVALVEKVHVDGGRASWIDISEWNYGAEWINEQCAVTSRFGVTTTRKKIAVQTVHGFWRPPARQAVAETIDVRHHQDIEWSPSSTRQCEQATQWWKDGRSTSNAVCQEVVNYCAAATPSTSSDAWFQVWWRKAREFFSSLKDVFGSYAEACMEATSVRTIAVDPSGRRVGVISGNGASLYDVIGSGGRSVITTALPRR
jgi:hypothetical protein